MRLKILGPAASNLPESQRALLDEEEIGDFWKYDPENDEWTKVDADFPGAPRYNAVAFVIGTTSYFRPLKASARSSLSLSLQSAQSIGIISSHLFTDFIGLFEVLR